MLPFELTKDTPYLALSGELWSVFYEYFNRNWSCYKGFLLYMYFILIASRPDKTLPIEYECLCLNSVIHRERDIDAILVHLHTKYGALEIHYF